MRKTGTPAVSLYWRDDAHRRRGGRRPPEPVDCLAQRAFKHAAGYRRGLAADSTGAARPPAARCDRASAVGVAAGGRRLPVAVVVWNARAHRRLAIRDLRNSAGI